MEDPRLGIYTILASEEPNSFPKGNFIQVARNAAQGVFPVDLFDQDGKLVRSLSAGASQINGRVPRIVDAERKLTVTFHVEGPLGNPMIVGQAEVEEGKGTAVFVAEDDGGTVGEDC